MKQQGEELLQFLLQAEKDLADCYHLNPGKQHFLIPVMPLEFMEKGEQQTLQTSRTVSGLILPFPIDSNASTEDSVYRFSLFRLLHVLISANLAFGSEERLPVSSHAFRFVDSLAGFMALEALTADHPED